MTLVNKRYIMSKVTVNQDYPLVNAKYKLNTSELKFILTAISQIAVSYTHLTLPTKA